MSILYCDSNCELWFTELKKYPIKLIKMPYTVDGVEYFYDMGENTDFAGFYQKMRAKAKTITSALNEADYIALFEEDFKKGEDILYISFSEKMSSTFQNMELAVDSLIKKYPKASFVRFDTHGISMVAGMLVKQAGIMALNGANNKKILKHITNMRDKAVGYFAVDDLMHLKRGGRLSGTAAVMGTMLSVKPILAVEDGTVKVKEKVKGKKQVVRTLIEKLQNADLNYEIYVLDADSIEISKELVAEINKLYPNATVCVQSVGPVITTHCGPGTSGVVFFTK